VVKSDQERAVIPSTNERKRGERRVLVYLQTLDSETDRSKVEQLYKRYGRLMKYVALQVLDNEHDAEDAVEQAFVSVMENLPKIGSVDSLETQSYVTVITERKAIDILRSRSKIVDMEFDETQPGIEITVQEDNGLAEAMARLPARYRQVLLLHYHVGYDTSEIAKMMGIKRTSVQKLLHRSRMALSKQLEEKVQ